jgi:hypothetical protein
MKTRPPKEIRNRREQGRKQSKTRRQQRFQFDWKFWVGTVTLGLVGLLLGAIALGPVVLAVPSVSIGAALDPADVLTTPIEISNTGWFDLKDVRVETFMRNLEYQNMSGATIRDNGAAGYFPPSPDLAPGEAKTVPFRNVFHFAAPLTAADVALIVFYREQYWPSFLRPKRKAFRFTTARQSNGTLILLKQPAEDTLVRYDAMKAAIGWEKQ